MYRTWTWRKATYSNNTTACVETASTGRHVLVRDTKNLHSPVIPVSPAAWQTFLHTVR